MLSKNKGVADLLQIWLKKAQIFLQINPATLVFSMFMLFVNNRMTPRFEDLDYAFYCIMYNGVYIDN